MLRVARCAVATHRCRRDGLPGPVEPQYLAGARLLGSYPLAVLYHGVGLFIAAMTMSGRVGLGFVGDDNSLPHLQHLAVYTAEAFDELENIFAGH